MRITAETKPLGGMSCLQSSDPGKATKITLVCSEGPQGAVAFILLTTRTRKAGCLTEPSNQGAKNLMVPLAELQRVCVEMAHYLSNVADDHHPSSRAGVQRLSHEVHGNHSCTLCRVLLVSCSWSWIKRPSAPFEAEGIVRSGRKRKKTNRRREH
ncbi:unnamed protein product [Pleuronectes platessa]|uniref:Uncharacterized protein n=1 Tax=Pleuronectes platessa TaxID=8262 RepID=A0A9N7TR40_PLEPL|nr:unnamed protein product [Pleuronectes platessa]